MTTEKKKKIRFNVIDFVIVLAVIAAVLGIFFRQDLKLTLNKETEYADVKVTVERLLTVSSDAIAVGDTIYNPLTAKPFGEIVSIEKKPSKFRSAANDGTIIYAAYEDRVDLTITIRMEGYFTENGFMLDGTSYMGVGSNLSIGTRNLTTVCTVLDVIRVQ